MLAHPSLFLLSHTFSREDLFLVVYCLVDDWMHARFGKGLSVAPEDYQRWEHQIKTPYSDLTEQEKQSDRDQVMRYWPRLEYYVREQCLELLQVIKLEAYHAPFNDPETAFAKRVDHHINILEAQLSSSKEKT